MKGKEQKLIKYRQNREAKEETKGKEAKQVKAGDEVGWVFCFLRIANLRDSNQRKYPYT